MRKLLSLFILILLFGCASIEPIQFVGPNGKTAYSMQCSGMGKTLDACYVKAGEMCPKGYAIVDSRSATVAIPLANGGFLAAPEYSMAIECK